MSVNMKKGISFFKNLLSQSFGFTLVELIVVISIVSVLTLTALAALDPFAQFQKANDAKRKADLGQIQKALEVYYQDNGKYPINNPSTTYKIYDQIQNKIIDWNSVWQPYMNVLPEDPKAGYSYIYYSPDGQYYYLYASLERGSKDPQVCNSDGSQCDNAPTGACGSGICNYGVSSPDKSP